MEIQVDGVNDALPAALSVLAVSGVRHTAASLANQRETLEHPGVFITVYNHPCQNVLFDAVRDANPFFHYLEAMWIIEGRRDVAFLKHVLGKMANYSDNGTEFHGAYGYRLRHHFDTVHFDTFDQIEQAITKLSKDPSTRQVVMSIWDPVADLGAHTKDLPCNDLIMLKVRDGKLNLTVANRSNDAIWGAYGANAVQFSMLQMYMAARLGIEVGRYTQVSDSMHVYTDTPYWQHYNERGPQQYVDPYQKYGLPERNLFHNDAHGGLDGMVNDPAGIIDLFDTERSEFFELFDESMADHNPEIEHLRLTPASPLYSNAANDMYRMFNALSAYKAGDYDAAGFFTDTISAPDWRLACQQWLQRREEKRNAK